MAVENPPLNRFYVLGYAANDKDFPIISANFDPRVAGYKVPEDLSTCPDKRYPNHVFTGAQPISGDERVRHVWEILPSPWVPFTRYDDDLGPIQGRRRSVANSGQQASLASDKKVSYEGREGSSIVSTEIEETWSIAVDEDGNSLFPIKVRDFYDPSKGAVEERRQLFVPTGEEEGTLENINGVITQTSYDVYNEYLSIKIVQTYKVSGPQLIGKTTDNDGQLVTVTTQRKGALDYIPPNPTATRTVEVSREDAESLVERIVDAPEVFKANTFSVERPDPIPQKFRVAVPLESSQEVVEGQAEPPSLLTGEISRTEEQRNKFIKRVSSTSRDQTVLPQTLVGKATDNDRQQVIITETLQNGNTSEVPSAVKTIESEALGDGNYLIRKTEVAEVFGSEVYRKTKDDLTPQKFRGAQEETTFEQNVEGVASENISLASGEFVKSEQQINKFVKRISTTSREVLNSVTLQEKVLTSSGQVGIRTLTLASGNQLFVPSALLVDASVEALGDGRTIKTEVVVPSVFPAKTIQKTKLDLTPQKFRAKQEDTTTEEIVVGTIQDPQLNENEFSKSEQQVTEFTKKISTNFRDIKPPETLLEFILTQEGQVAKKEITLLNGSQEFTPSSTLIDANIETLGDGRTVKTETTVNNVFNSKQETKEKLEVVPAEFRASIPTKTVSEVKSGISSNVSNLSGDEISKTIQRITENKIRETTITRPTTLYPSLYGVIIDNNLLKVTRIKTLVKGEQTIVPSATVSGTIEAIGDDYTIKTEDIKEKVFDDLLKSKRQSTQLPPKFVISETQESLIEEGQNINPETLGTDGTGVTESSAQRITEFTIRKSKTTVEANKNISEEQINTFKQKITIASEIVDSPEIDVGAKIEISRTQAIGGGKFLKETGSVNELFDSMSKSSQKPDTIPEKFRVNSPIKRTEKIVEKNTANEQTLGSSEYLKTEQRLTDFTVQTTTVERDDNYNSVKSKRLEENWGIEIPYEEYINNSIPSGSNIEADGLNDKDYLVREYSQQEIQNILSSFSVEIPTSIDLDIPRILKKITLNWQEERASSNNETDTTGLMGSFTNLEQKDGGAISSTLSLIPSLDVEFEDIWGKNLPATIHLFFLKKENLDLSNIRSEIGASDNWPVFKPRSFSTTVFGKTETKTLESSISRAIQINNTPAEYGYIPSKSSQEYTRSEIRPISVNIPACICDEIKIDNEKELSLDENLSILLNYQATNINVSYGSIELSEVNIEKELQHSITCSVKFTVPASSGQTDVPRSGVYLISCSAEPYKFGWFLVRAVSFDASILSD